jgi:ribonuclease-3
MNNASVPPMESLYLQLGHIFKDHSLLGLALTHKSFSNEKAGGAPTVNLDNERLEFLGDAVLDLIISDLLMERFPGDTEGALSKKRASLVNEDTLAGMALELKMDVLIRLGKGEVKTGGLQKPRILASGLEAIIGAIFRDGGYVAARASLASLFASRLDALALSQVDYHHDFKTRLQEKTQEAVKNIPNYIVEKEHGPDHDKTFEVTVRLEGKVLATGLGRSKKAAEQEAARQALEQYK